jgi:hypothetical protein
VPDASRNDGRDRHTPRQPRDGVEIEVVAVAVRDDDDVDRRKSLRAIAGDA